MARIDYLIFGYRRLTVSPEDLSLVTSILLRAAIPSRINPDGTLSIRERDFSKVQDLFSGRIDFEYSKPLGLYGMWKLCEGKGALIATLALCLVLTAVLSSLVWDVRVEGNEKIPDSEIVCALSECGFSVGDFWISRDLGVIEAKFLSTNDGISWINVNRRGTVAYVSVIEKDAEKEEEKENVLYSNIVASADCVIEEITVKKGIAMVRAGDAVKKGDILILGAMPSESGGGFCAAEGEVLGRISESVSVSVGRSYEKRTLSGRRLYSCTINLFKISLNIFKSYGNLTNKYDIIENEITYSLFGRCRLPFSITLEYIPEYTVEKAEYTDEELVRIASDRLSVSTLDLLSCSDLLRLRTYGDFEGDGYTITSEITYLASVGKNSAFDLE
nr:hypothetical protein [Oscillospiraceae bacterium]